MPEQLDRLQVRSCGRIRFEAPLICITHKLLIEGCDGLAVCRPFCGHSAAASVAGNPRVAESWMEEASRYGGLLQPEGAGSEKSNRVESSSEQPAATDGDEPASFLHRGRWICAAAAGEALLGRV